MPRKTYAIIQLENLYQNYKNVVEKSGNKKVIPVVKANAYGHGAIEVVRYLASKGIKEYAVSLVEEADELREHFKDIDILIMGVTHEEDFIHAAENNYTITVVNTDQIDSLLTLNKELKVHIKIDSGMNRLGFKYDNEIKSAVDILKKHQYINLEGIYTHYATADCDYDYFLKQKNRFEEVLNYLDYDFKVIHTSNSSSSIKYEKDIEYTTHTRLGISLYGLSLDEDMEFLKDTYRLCSHIAEIKHLKKGEKLGYSITYEAKENEVIAVLPIGYADGFIRKNQGGKAEINNKIYNIVGRICMDQMFVKVDDSVKKDDCVILMGGKVSIDDVAKRLETINYEIICQITYRVPKKYRKE